MTPKRQLLLVAILILALQHSSVILTFLVAERIIVHTEIGKFLGKPRTTESKGTKHHVFENIPYAEPPIGDLRFQPPTEMVRTNNTWRNRRNGQSCIQIDVYNPLSFRGSEDCLYLKVFTTALYKDYKIKLPVVVWIHGGFFFTGNTSENTYSLDYFIDNNIVSVSIAYRLGFLGFYYNEDDIFGNMGLKDQLMALKWISKYIQYFGGDPKRITIMGESAGAACVSYLVQSPLASDLFQRAIMMSGNSLASWAVARDSHGVLEGFIMMVNFVDMITKRLSKLLYSIIPTIKMFLEMAFDPLDGLLYAPVIENPNPTAIATEESYKVLTKCKEGNFVPIIIGHTSNEGKVLVGYSLVTKVLANLLNIVYGLFSTGLVPADMMPLENCSELGDEVHRFYKLSTASELGKFLGDAFFVVPTILYARLYSKCNDVYMYRMSYNDAGHGDDLPYFFSNYELKTDEDKRIHKILMGLWTNFIRFGNPTPDLNEFGVEWKKSSSTKKGLVYLNVDRTVESLDFSKSSHWPAMKFWMDLQKKCELNVTLSHIED